MKLSGMSFFQMASQRMRWLGARQDVVAQNIANADTPGYKARDVGAFSQMVNDTRSPAGLAVTNAGHIQGSSKSTAPVRVEEDATAWEAGLDGNNVTLEQQTIKSAEVSENYRLAADLYRKGHDLVTLAVTGIR
ncbi:flagellar basal body rod protein FlgB [Pseudooceanicola aestuarii]|uniref:flagellar basal body rod protein FlgB n=1 Tax=Pseudooceanicola aestuarii TaxID=2697319 RepID=UPI0013D8DC10|nr:flagellar basal body rod protein FlgB [Pseudooceanicola aestuarii]